MSRFELFANLIIIFVALALRLPGMDRDVWLDEAFTVMDVRGVRFFPLIDVNRELTGASFQSERSLSSTLRAVADNEIAPPVYFLILHVWVTLVGEHNWALRIPSLVAGLGTIPVTFLIGKALGGTRVGLASAAAMAVLPLPIHYSREARMYILALFFGALSTWLWIRLLQRSQDPICSRGFWAYLAAALLAAFSHFHIAGLFAAQALMILFWPRSQWSRSILRFSILGVVFLALVLGWFAFTGAARQQSLIEGSGPSGDRLAWMSQLLPERLLALACIDFVGDLPTIKCRSPLGVVVLATMLTCAAVIAAVWRGGGENRRAVLVSLVLLLAPIVYLVVIAIVLDLPRWAVPVRFSIFNQVGLSLAIGLSLGMPVHFWARAGLALLMVILAGHYQLRWAEVRANPPGGTYLLALGNYSRVVRTEIEQHASEGPLLFSEWGHLLMWSVYDTGPTPRMPMVEIRSLADRRPELNARVRDLQTRFERVRVMHQLDLSPPSQIEVVERYFILESTRTDAGVAVRTYVRAP